MKPARGRRPGRRRKTEKSGCVGVLFWLILVIGGLQILPLVYEWLGWDFL